MTTNWSPPRKEQRPSRSWKPFIAILGLALASFFLVNVCGVSAASFGKVQNFAPKAETPPNPPTWPEDVQLGGASGMAINLTGAGGVAPGTVYTIGWTLGEWHAARYSPTGEFELAWTAVSRCGPQVTPPSACPTYPEGTSGGVDIAVDQATGNVYTFFIDESKTVKEYNANGTNSSGTGAITEFGEVEPTGTIATSPGKLHNSQLNENIAVDDSGAVYITDEDTFTDQAHRLMMFKPQTPGDYEHYVYAGQGSDIANGAGSNPPFRPVLDDSGNVYVAGETYIEEYKPTQPTTPICKFSLTAGGITSITVDPATGAPFFYSFKDRLVHQLSPCNAQGKFVEQAADPPFSPVPQRGNLEAMAFNPDLEWAEEVGGVTQHHPAGVLYAGAARECPSVGGCPEDAKGKSAQGYIFAPEIPNFPPAVVSESVSQVKTSTATLTAEINPKGPQTSYVFQYLTEASYEVNSPLDRFAGATEVPLGGAVLGSGQQPLLATITLSGLSPGTGYRYRVVATNSVGATPGADEAFRTFPPEIALLPDNRAYELVSPPQKNGGEVLPAEPTRASCGVNCKPGKTAGRFPVRVSPSGDSIAYEGSPFVVNEGASEFDGYISTRGASGWETTSLSPPLVGDSGGAGFKLFGVNTDLSSVIAFARNQALVPEAPPGYLNLFGEQTVNRFDLSPLITNTNASLHREPNEGPNGFKLTYVGASKDFSRQFFEANDALTEATANAPASQDGGPSKSNLYEWSGGQLHLVNVQSLNAETLPGAVFGSGFELSTGESAPAEDFSNAISADGSRVFWTSATGQLLVRIKGERTLEVPSPSNCKSSTPRAARVCFVTASVDGSSVLMSNGTIYQLNEEESAYEPFIALTGGLGGFQGLVGQSDDLTSAYFVATTVLTGTPNDHGAVAAAGKDNLYAWNGSTTAFVGRLLPTDLQEFGTWKDYPVRRSAEASPNGRWLAFNSEGQLTGPSEGNCGVNPTTEEFFGPAPCGEVYLYDSQSGTLTCPSCNPAGAPPLGASRLLQMTNAAGYLEQPRYLTNEGRLYFDSRDALSSFDTNNGVEDVYQYEPDGIGSCGETGGCVSLISSGTGPYDSNFLAMDSSGNNVFFTTRQQLVPRDRDGLIDLYDARAGGGIASEANAPPKECQGEGCQPLLPAPAEPTTNSGSAEGGNVPLQCKKGKVKRNGKCVKKAKHKKHGKQKKKNGKKTQAGAGGSK